MTHQEIAAETGASLGYISKQTRDIQVDVLRKSADDDRERVKALRAQGLSYDKIAAATSWSHGTIQRLLGRRTINALLSFEERQKLLEQKRERARELRAQGVSVRAINARLGMDAKKSVAGVVVSADTTLLVGCRNCSANIEISLTLCGTQDYPVLRWQDRTWLDCGACGLGFPVSALISFDDLMAAVRRAGLAEQETAEEPDAAR